MGTNSKVQSYTKSRCTKYINTAVDIEHLSQLVYTTVRPANIVAVENEKKNTEQPSRCARTARIGFSCASECERALSSRGGRHTKKRREVMLVRTCENAQQSAAHRVTSLFAGNCRTTNGRAIRTQSTEHFCPVLLRLSMARDKR